MRIAVNILIFVVLYFHTDNIIAQDNCDTLLTKVTFIEDANTFNGIIDKYNGNVIYIDLWASWCGACYNEFKHNEELEKFFKENDIIRVYIALEKEQIDKIKQQESIVRWKNIALKNNLEGDNYYVIFKSELYREISDNLIKGKISLPHFSILDKQGNIVVRNANRPTNCDGVIKQLSKYILD